MENCIAFDRRVYGSNIGLDLDYDQRSRWAMEGIMSTESTETEDYEILYRRAFEKFGARALWSSVPVPNPTRADALAITHSLRVEGDREARRLAEQIEQACRANWV